MLVCRSVCMCAGTLGSSGPISWAWQPSMYIPRRMIRFSLETQSIFVLFQGKFRIYFAEGQSGCVRVLSPAAVCALHPCELVQSTTPTRAIREYGDAWGCDQPTHMPRCSCVRECIRVWPCRLHLASSPRDKFSVFVVLHVTGQI